MKILLISVNVILAFLLIAGAVRFFRNSAPPAKSVYSVPKRTGTIIQPKIPQKAVSSQAAEKPSDPQTDYNTVVRENIFNQERCPNSGIGSRNARVSMTLVGICVIGEMKGAVILQKSTGNSWMPPMMGGGPGMGGGRRQGFAQGNRNGRRNNEPGMGGPPMGPGMGGPPPPFMMQRNQNQNNEVRQNYKQFVRVGETLANGYKLIEVTRTTATLTRGGDKTELELQEASVNAPKGNSNSNNSRMNGRNMMQQFINTMQNMQRMQGFQNMQNMRMMQQMMNNNNGGMPGNNNSRGGRRNNR